MENIKHIEGEKDEGEGGISTQNSASRFRQMENMFDVKWKTPNISPDDNLPLTIDPSFWLQT